MEYLENENIEDKKILDKKTAKSVIYDCINASVFPLSRRLKFEKYKIVYHRLKKEYEVIIYYHGFIIRYSIKISTDEDYVFDQLSQMNHHIIDEYEKYKHVHIMN